MRRLLDENRTFGAVVRFSISRPSSIHSLYNLGHPVGCCDDSGVVRFRRIGIESAVILSLIAAFYKLPKLFQWFTGNIGFHHIHHLSPKIPNYKLEQCHIENPVFQVEPLTFKRSLQSLFFRLWDEKEKMLVGWEALKKYRAHSGNAKA